MTLDLSIRTDDVLTSDTHLIQSFANLNALKQDGARTAIVRAEGAHVFDSEGNKMIDGIGGLWCVNVGHGRDEIIDAITEQLRTLDYYSTFYNFTHPAAAALAEKVASLAPGQLNHLYFSNSGSVANDTAVRILHHYNILRGKGEKRQILSRMGAYHGSTHLAMAMTTPAYSDGWHTAAEGLVHHLKAPHKYREAPEMDDADFLKMLEQDMLDTIHRIGADKICAFFAEPIQGAGGVICAPKGYHRRMRKITAEHDIAYVADEVVTAWGRLGHMFASEAAYDCVPDIITTAKGLTSGYQPLAATIISSEIHDVISSPDAMFLHGMTYSGHPAAAAAGLANIAILEREGIPERVRTSTGVAFEAALRGLSDMAMVGEVRGSHFMIGIEFVKNKDTREEFDDDAQIGSRVASAAQERGLIARALGNILILSPTLILDEALIEEVAGILRESIAQVSSELGI